MARTLAGTRTLAGARSLATRTPNIIYNSGFEIAPPVLTAGTNTVTRWINGTAAGSTAQGAYGWAVPTGGYLGTAEAAFDTSIKFSGSYSLRLSNLDATGAISVSSFRNASVREYFVLAPNTSYTLTFQIKTSNVPSNGAFVDLRQFNAAGTTLATTSSTKKTGTNDWSQVTLTLTTQATTAFGALLLRNNVAGNICDAWFDSITLARTTPQNRTTA